MALKDQLTVQLRGDEGEELSAYTDHLGYWTIGIGRLIDRRKGGCITREEAAYLLSNDIERRLVDLRRRVPWFDTLDEARQGVLLNMSFQMGVDGVLGFVRTLALIRSGQYDAAAAAMLESTWAKQTPERAHRMAEQMRTGNWQFSP